MSRPSSPSSTPYLSPLEQDDSPQRSAVSDSARQERLAALERRLSPPHSHAQAAAATPQDPQPFDDNHAKRNEFRRLVDPGIVRPNSKDVALRSLRVNLKSSFCCRERAEGMTPLVSPPPFPSTFFFFPSWIFLPIDPVHDRGELASRA